MNDVLFSSCGVTDPRAGGRSANDMEATFLPIERSALLGAIDQMTVLTENAVRLHLPRVMECAEKPRKEALPPPGKRNDRGGPDIGRWK